MTASLERLPLVRSADPGVQGPRSDWTTDGLRFYFARETYEGDIWMVEPGW